jgi:beta-lactamase regulating signal transducer with metallopeptidase domain
LLKVQLSRRPSGVACAWAPPGRHPLEVRLATLGQGEPGLRRHVGGAVGVVALAVVLSTAVWGLAPKNGPGVDAGRAVISPRISLNQPPR